MKMVDLSVFFDEAATRIAGAPLETLRQELRATLREFYVRSGSYVLDSVPKDIIANQRQYDVSTQPTGDVLYVYRARVEGNNVTFAGTAEPGVITLTTTYPNDISAGLICEVSLRPRSYDIIPEATTIYDFDTILDGVTGRMFMMPDKPWTNGPQAEYYLRRFVRGQSTARERVRKQYTRNNTFAGFPPW